MFHVRGFVQGLALKQRQKATEKLPIKSFLHEVQNRPKQTPPYMCEKSVLFQSKLCQY